MAVWWFLAREDGEGKTTLSVPIRQERSSKEEAGTLALIRGRREDQEAKGLKPEVSTQIAVRERELRARSETCYFSLEAAQRST